MTQPWKLSATIWINPAHIVEVFDHPDEETISINYAVGSYEMLAYRTFEKEERQALLAYLNNPTPEGFGA